MRRGTTPTLTIEVEGAELTQYEVVQVAFRQGEKVELYDGEVVDDEHVKVSFTQEETLAYATGPVEVQLKCKVDDWPHVVASNIITIPMREVISEEVL